MYPLDGKARFLAAITSVFSILQKVFEYAVLLLNTRNNYYYECWKQLFCLII